MSILADLADNGLSGCGTVVVENSRKWGDFGEALSMFYGLCL